MRLLIYDGFSQSHLFELLFAMVPGADVSSAYDLRGVLTIGPFRRIMCTGFRNSKLFGLLVTTGGGRRAFSADHLRLFLTLVPFRPIILITTGGGAEDAFATRH